jgi:DnaJ-domain-containing protein 1
MRIMSSAQAGTMRGRQERQANLIPHVARNTRGRCAVPEKVAHTPQYAVSQRRRKLVEEPFGWRKTVGQSRKLRYLGVARRQLWFLMAAAGYNLIRVAKLSPQPA